MGADIYNKRYAARQENLVLAQAHVSSMMHGQITDENREEFRAAYDKSQDELSYFRDSYNDSSVLWQLGLSWWKDLPTMEYTDEQAAEWDKNDSWPDINVDVAGCRKFLKLINSRKKLFAVNLTEMTDEEEREYFIKKRETLIAFLEQAIEDGGLYASV